MWLTQRVVMDILIKTNWFHARVSFIPTASGQESYHLRPRYEMTSSETNNLYVLADFTSSVQSISLNISSKFTFKQLSSTFTIRDPLLEVGFSCKLKLIPPSYKYHHSSTSFILPDYPQAIMETPKGKEKAEWKNENICCWNGVRETLTTANKSSFL